MDPEIIEAVKMVTMLTYMLMEMSGMDAQQQQDMLDAQRERFKANRAKPLPDV